MSSPSILTVDRFYGRCRDSLRLRLVAGEAGLTHPILEPTVNRPGLALAGFTKYYAKNRIQVFGSVETHYLKSLAAGERRARLEAVLTPCVPCAVFCRNLRPMPAFLELAKRAGIPVFRSPLVTMRFINRATLALEDLFAPRGLELGSMVDILGVGVVIRGESGIGKSECVLALIERGYSLVSDDVTRVRVQEGKDIIGTSPPNTRNHMEVRGIGIIDVPAMFGVRGIRTEKRVDLVVTLKPWEQVPDMDRIGLDQTTVDILGLPIPHMVIPVRPGRDIARLVEVAAFHTKLRIIGYNPAEAFNNRLIDQMQRPAPG